jgi:DNA polymerase III subunit delta
MTYPQIISDIQKGQFAPVYYLHGEESFLIEKIYHALAAEGAVLQPGEEDFNRELFYGPDTRASQVVHACRSFPIMANRRLVILKEAQRMNPKELEKLTPYLKQPVPSSVLVMLFKDRRAGLPKAAANAAGKAGVNFHAKKLYDRDVQQWTEALIREKGYQCDPEIPAVLVNNLGLNLNLIENELDKMFIYLKATQQQRLSKEFVFQMINVDKEFNAFELVSALSQHQVQRSHLIIDRLTRNTKVNPPTLVVGALFRFFHHLALVHRYQLRDPNSAKHQLGLNYFQARDAVNATRHYPVGKVYRNLGYIEETDQRLKGMIPSYMDEAHALKTLVWRLLR